jgi:hypothetical protein
VRLIPALIAAALLAGAPRLAAQTRPEGSVPARNHSGAVRNPGFLRASELLTRRDPSESRRVRFEWEQVGAIEYVLQGQWVEPGSWATRKREFTVTTRTAARWDDELVALEVALEPGAHSWSIVAVFPGKGVGDFVNPTRLSFEVR